MKVPKPTQTSRRGSRGIMQTLPLGEAIDAARQQGLWPFVIAINAQVHILFAHAPRVPGNRPDATWHYCSGEDGRRRDYATVDEAAEALTAHGIKTFIVEV